MTVILLFEAFGVLFFIKELLCYFAFSGFEEGKKYVEKAVSKYKEILNSVDELCRSLREFKQIQVFFFYVENIFHLHEHIRFSVIYYGRDISWFTFPLPEVMIITQ